MAKEQRWLPWRRQRLARPAGGEGPVGDGSLTLPVPQGFSLGEMEGRKLTREGGRDGSELG
jgi:hypothetical protein